MSLELDNMKFDVSYKSETGTPEINAINSLNAQRSKNIRSVLKSILLLSSLFLCSVALATCQVSEAMSWITLLLSIVSVVAVFSTNKIFRVLSTSLLKKDTEPKEYHFGKDGIAISGKTETFFTGWDAVSEQGKIHDFTYLILNNQKVILINNNKMPKDELVSLQTLLKEKTSDKDSNIANNNQKQTATNAKALSYVVASIVALGIVYCLIILCYPLSDQELFRLWFCRDTHLVLSTLLGVTTLTWFLITVKQIKINFKKSLLKRCIAWIALILVIIALGLGMLINLVKNDRTEYPNDDKTITIEQPVWLDKTQYSLYQKSGIFTLKHLRNTEGFQIPTRLLVKMNILKTSSQNQLITKPIKKRLSIRDIER